MPVTARLSRRFYDVLGEDVANELVDWFNAVSSLRLIAYVPAPGTGTREKMEQLLAAADPVLETSLEAV